MEFSIEFPKEEFAGFLDEYLGGGHEQESEGQTSSHVEYDGSNAGAYLGDAGMTVLIGIVVVLSALLVLCGVFKLFGVAMSASGSKPKTDKKAAPSAPAAEPAVSSVPAPVVQNGISDEVVAVIAAAIAAMSPDGKRYAVKRISRTDVNGRSAWASAGIADNTRPF